MFFNLTFDKNLKTGFIAKVKNGKKNGEIIKFTDKKPEKMEKKELYISDYEKDLKMFKPKDRQKVFKQIEKMYNSNYDDENDEVFEEDIKDVFRRVKEREDSKKEYKLQGEEVFVPVLNKDKHFLYYITGASESGKSYVASMLIDSYHKLYPKRHIFLISKLDKDETLDKLKYIKRLDLESFVKEPPVITEFDNSLLLFDDYENLPSTIFNMVLSLINDVAIQGRHSNIDGIVISHISTNYQKTKVILSECTDIIVFPHHNSYQSMESLLKTYCGFKSSQIANLRNLNSRWVLFHRRAPNYILGEKSIELI